MYTNGTQPIRRQRPFPWWLMMVALATSTTALPAEEGGRWIARVSGVWLSPAGDLATVDRSTPDGGQVTQVVDDDASGYGLGLEYRVGPRFGFEAGVVRLDKDTTMQLDAGGATVVDVETIAVTSTHLGANWHNALGDRTDVSLGVLVAQTSFKDAFYLTEVGLSEKRTFDDDIGFGARAALAVGLGNARRWAIVSELRYLDTIMESEVAGQDLEFNPTILTVGVSYQF